MAINLNSKFILAILFLLGTCAYEVTSRTLPLEEASLVQRHERWMAHHARSYKDDVEKVNRFKIFKQNLEFIESFNKAGNHSYKLGLNKFSDMSPEEFKATMLIDENNFVRPTTKFPKGNSLGNNESTLIDPPNSVNWVERGAVTAIRDQLKCGACWAFSTVAAVEGITQIKTGRLVPLSEQQLMDCDETNNGCGGGWPTKAFQYVQEANGLMPESDYPYKGYKQATCATTGGYAAATITGFEQVEQGEDALLQAVTNQPVSTVISLDGYVLQHYESGVFATDCGSGELHAITVVGYGATMEGDKYWLVKSNLHKWFFCPPSVAFLYCKNSDRLSDLHHPVVSLEYGNGLPIESTWIGTRDYSAQLVVPQVMALLSKVEGGIEGIRRRNHEKVVEMAEMLAKAWGTNLGAPREMCSSMAMVGMPACLGISSDSDALRLRSHLRDCFRVEVPIYYRPPLEGDGDVNPITGYARISHQVYNKVEDYYHFRDVVNKLVNDGFSCSLLPN